MLRTPKCLAALLLTLCLSGCVIAPVVPPLGGFYTDIRAPLDLDSEGGKRIGPDVGVSTSWSILGLVALGDAGIEAAARQGRLETVNHVDYRFQNYVMGVFSRFTTVVYGVAESPDAQALPVGETGE